MNEKKELDVKISYSCNNNCVFCLNKNKRGTKKNIALIKRSIKNFTEKGGESLIISGGEPLILPDLFELLFFSKKKGIKSFQIQTNGRMLYYENVIKNLKKFEPMSFLVSFQFPNDKLYKKYCQSDGFYQVVEGLKNLIKYNCNFLTNTVVMKPNLIYLEDMIKILKKTIGIKRKINYRFIDGKNVIDNYREFVPRYKECVPILEKIIKKNKEIEIFLNEFPPCVLDKNIRNKAGIRIDPNRENLTSRGELLLTKEIENIQFIYPNCKNCLYKSECLGVRKEYIKIYGDKEFKPIIR